MAKALAYALPSPGLAECFQHLLPSGAKRSKSDQPQQVQRCGARLHRAGYQRFTTSFRCAGGFAPVAAGFWGIADADPGLADVLRRSVGALRPGDGMDAATLMIHGSERDFASSLVLAADLMVQRLLVGLLLRRRLRQSFSAGRRPPVQSLRLLRCWELLHLRQPVKPLLRLMLDALQQGVEPAAVMRHRFELGGRHPEGFRHQHQFRPGCGRWLSLAEIDQPVDHPEAVGFPAQLGRIVAQPQPLGTEGPGGGIPWGQVVSRLLIAREAA